MTCSYRRCAFPVALNANNATAAILFYTGGCYEIEQFDIPSLPLSV